MAIDLNNALIWPMRDGKCRGTGVVGYAPSLTPFRPPNTQSPYNSGSPCPNALPRFMPTGDRRMPRGFGAARCPYATGSNNADPAGGFVFDIELTTWFLAMLDAGRTVRIAIAQQNAGSDISTGFHLAPVIQTGHASGQIIFRVRYDNASGGCLNTVIGQYTGSPSSPTLDTSSVIHAQTDEQIATNSGNMTEWYIQYTPSDSAISTTNKHNLYVAVRTRDASGSDVFPISMYAHFGTSTGGSNPRMPISDKRMSLGKNIDDVVTGGTIGDYLGIIADAAQDSSVETNENTIGAELDTIWTRAAKYITRRDLRGRNRSGVYAVA